MKCKILAVLVLGTVMSVTTGTILAQSQEQVEKFKEEQRKYYTEKLELTAQEGKDFWPIYDDFLNRKMKLVEDERNTWTYAHKNAENLSDTESVILVSQWIWVPDLKFFKMFFSIHAVKQPLLIFR